ncbi:MAG: hypothetical protein H6527_01395 [Actinobacteria bacterium]|nr:hypothetical protein [Actinomycetota bacterium]
MGAVVVGMGVGTAGGSGVVGDSLTVGDSEAEGDSLADGDSLTELEISAAGWPSAATGALTSAKATGVTSAAAVIHVAAGSIKPR